MAVMEMILFLKGKDLIPIIEYDEKQNNLKECVPQCRQEKLAENIPDTEETITCSTCWKIYLSKLSVMNTYR